jgi:hypothetical protein
MKIHKLEHGDIIKILPMVGTNNEIIMFKKLDAAHISNSIIFDTKGYLKRISYELSRNWISSGGFKLPISTRYYMNILVDGEIRLLHVGRTLFNLISNNPEVLDIKSDYRLNIVKEEVMDFPVYDKSRVIKSRWTPPVHINSEREWLNWIKSNQPDLTNYVNNNSIFVHKQLLIDHLGKDMLGELISDDRQKKLNQLI